MKPKFIIITNNPLVQEKLHKDYPVQYYNQSYEEILKKTRDYIHEGYELLSHPLSGSIKPNETPYKSVMISAQKGDLDTQSMEIIDNALHAIRKFEFKSDRYKPKVYEDFQLIDYTLIESAIPSAIAW